MSQNIFVLGVPVPRGPGEPGAAPPPPGDRHRHLQQRQVHLQVPRGVPAATGNQGGRRRKNIWKIILKKCLPSYRKYLCVEVKSRGEQIQGINTLLYFSGYGDNIKPMIYPSAHHSVSLSANTVFSAEPALTLTRGNLTKYLPSCKKYLLHTHRLHFMFSPRHHPAADCNFTTFTRNISSS